MESGKYFQNIGAVQFALDGSGKTIQPLCGCFHFASFVFFCWLLLLPLARSRLLLSSSMMLIRSWRDGARVQARCKT